MSARILWKCVFKFEVVSVNLSVDVEKTIKVMHSTGYPKCGFDFRCGMCVPIKQCVHFMAHTSVVMVLISGRTQC